MAFILRGDDFDQWLKDGGEISAEDYAFLIAFEDSGFLIVPVPEDS